MRGGLFRQNWLLEGLLATRPPPCCCTEEDDKIIRRHGPRSTSGGQPTCLMQSDAQQVTVIDSVSPFPILHFHFNACPYTGHAFAHPLIKIPGQAGLSMIPSRSGAFHI